MNWWQRAWQRGQLERQLDAELRDHVDRLIADNIRAGMSDEEARRAARLEFGGVDQLKEDCRDARATRWVHDMARDLRVAVRVLRHERWFASVAVVSLALGIGVCAMMFTVINAYYFRGLPVDRPDRMLSLGTRHIDGREQGVSYQDYQDWRAAATSFDGMAAFSQASMTIGDEGLASDRVSGAYVSADIFHLLGVVPALGRSLRADDDRVGASPVALLGHRLWMNRYGGDPSILGRSIRVDGTSSTVIGIMPESFGFPFLEELWLPLASMPGLTQQDRDARVLGVLARLDDDGSRTRATTELRAIAARLAAVHPQTNAGIDARAERFGEQQIGSFALDSPPGIAAATAVFVLLIACGNVANLLLARSANRAREIAIRTSVGATRWRIVRQLLVESLLLACVAGLVGFGLSFVGVRAMSDAFAGNVPYWLVLTADSRSIAALVVTCVTATVLFGLAPALALSKTGVGRALNESGRAGLPPRAGRWSARLVAAQFALTTILLGGAGLLVRSFVALYEVDSIVDTSPLMTMRLELPERLDSPERRAVLYSQLEEHIGASPNVASATLASALPFLGAPRRSLTILDNGTSADAPPLVATIAIGANYFDTLGVSLLHGRPFEDVDGAPGRDVAIVNRLFVDRYLAEGAAIGRQIRLTLQDQGGASAWLTIVGVSPTIRQAVASGPRPVVYVPHRAEHGASTRLIVRSVADPKDVSDGLRKTLAAIDDEVVLSGAAPLDDALRNSRLQPQIMTSLLGAFGTIALILAGIGLYAITAYAVGQRTREIGVRMALGARPSQVVGHFMRRGLTPIGFGVAIGLLGAVGVGAVLRSLIGQTAAADPIALVSLVILLTSVAVSACFVPARRAARIDPAVTLRHD